MHPFLFFIFGLVALKALTELFLNALNRKAVLANEHTIPSYYTSFIDRETYQKSIAYTLAKNFWQHMEILFGVLLLGAILIGGFLPWSYTHLTALLGTGYFAQAVALMIIISALQAFELPLEWFYHFRIEAQFGFNTMTPRLWVADKVKSFLLLLIVGVPLLAAFFVFLSTFPHNWWILGFLAVIAFQIIMLLVYPLWILPLFNKLKPLEDGETKTALLDLCKKLNFPAKKLFVMDGSKRSLHANAFFAGFGKNKHIVLFDTLLAQLSLEELEAVLAHEIGHYKKRHLFKRMGVTFATTFALFALIGWLIKQPFFYTAFGFAYPSPTSMPAFLLLIILGDKVTFWLTPLGSLFSRKHEFEADSFAKKSMNGNAKPLIEALRKLNKKSLTNLTPHPCYSAFYYSHPTLLDRSNALEKA